MNECININTDGSHQGVICEQGCIYCLDCRQIFKNYEHKQSHFDRLDCDDMHRVFRENARKPECRTVKN